jgi:AAHS family 4-hydroxybenzoate transporter-like MFS transporter
MVADAEPRTLDVTAFLENAGITRFHVWLLILSCFVTFFDGLDFSLDAYTLPQITAEMGLTTAMAGYFTAATSLGQMIGSLVGSYVADVVGRRPVIIVCTFLGAVLTFATGFAPNPTALVAMRLIGGLAIGGLLAPAWALNIEAMPHARRATAVTIIMLGFSVGGAAAGQVVNWIAPQHGWQGVFFFSGALTGALAILLFFTLPESARWLVAKGRPAALVIPLLSRFGPAADVGQYAHFTLSDERTGSQSESPLAKIRELFRGALVYVTPLVWAAYFFSSFAIYFRAKLGVLSLTTYGLDAALANNISSISGLLGAVAGVLLLLFTERRGPGWIILAPLIGIPALIVSGLGVQSQMLFIEMVALGSIMIGAEHAAVISITTIYYPSAVRSTGGGWASFVAKIAAVAAPIVGAQFFLGGKAAVLSGFLFSAACLVGLIICLLALAYFARRLHAERELEISEPVVA